jgi:LacI family transcriptional regulator
MMGQIRQVALALSMSVPHQVLTLQGIVDFARQHQQWRIHFSPDRYTISLADLVGWPGHGVITVIETPAQARTAPRIGLPVINLSGILRRAGVPRVMVDQEAIGRMAAEHLLECGFQRFGYYGPPGVWYATLRRRGFTEHLRREDCPCSVLEVTGGMTRRRPGHRWQESLQRWLKALRPPVGILAASDAHGAILIEACDQIGLCVPHDVAVIGVDNHELTCELCHVPLSSVSRSARLVGFEAARLLDQWMAGGRRPRADVLIPPDGVVRRRSTDVQAVDDPHVAVTVRYIREHVDEVFGVERLLPLVPLSRRWLEHRFRDCLGVTPHEFISRVRVERAKQLLGGSRKLSMHQVAQACGFADSRRFRIVFQRIAGTTPTDYRRNNQEFAPRHVESPRVCR